jgi:Insertion element 4 transposase N-terminal/Transposase DDE domain
MGMRLSESIDLVSEFGLPENFDRLKEHLDPAWIEEALQLAGTATIRRRRLPAEQVIWLVIAMALYRNQPIEQVVDDLDLALPDQGDTVVAKSAITQARQRVKEDALAYLFATTAEKWAGRSADERRWRGLALYGLDGTTIRVADSPENRAAFGGQTGRGGTDSGYPQVRVVALLALRSHLMSAFRFANYGTGETTLAREIWREVPENSLTIIDRNFLVARELIHLECSGNRHWLSRSKARTKYAVVEKLGRDDSLVVLEIKQDGLPRTWLMRAINYKKKGFPPSTLLTSLTDAEAYPAKELVELYHERWELEIAYDEMKTHLLEREETIRSRTVEGVHQELWGIAIAYNLVRLEMERAAAELKVPPTRVSFVAALAMFRNELRGMSGRRPLAMGTIPSRLDHLRRNLKRLVLPERRRERSYPRQVKIKMSNYDRKRPSTTPTK